MEAIAEALDASGAAKAYPSAVPNHSIGRKPSFARKVQMQMQQNVALRGTADGLSLQLMDHPGMFQMVSHVRNPRPKLRVPCAIFAVQRHQQRNFLCIDNLECASPKSSAKHVFHVGVSVLDKQYQERS